MPITYAQRQAITLKIVQGIEYECWRQSHGYERRLKVLAHSLGVAEAVLRACCNPARKRPPSKRLREQLERVSIDRAWPRAVLAREWLAP